MDEIYLDHASATPLAPEARAAMEACRDVYANPASLHAGGRQAKHLVESARQQILRALKAEDGYSLVFTSGGTEGNNTVVNSFATPGSHIVASAIEHKCVVAPLQAAAERGATVVWVKPEESGFISAPAVAASTQLGTALVSVMLVNNELGTIQPIPEIAAAVHAAGALLHTDAAQGFGKLPMDLPVLGADIVTLSSHKLGGPKGVGAVAIRKGVPLEPLLRGGGQESGWRSGTENVQAIVGFAAAVCARLGSAASTLRYLHTLHDECERRLVALDPARISINGRGAPRVPYILSVRFAGQDAADLMVRLDARGIRVGTGAACTAHGSGSSVLRAIGHSRDMAQETIRFSFSPQTTMAEIETALGCLSHLLTD